LGGSWERRVLIITWRVRPLLLRNDLLFWDLSFIIYIYKWKKYIISIMLIIFNYILNVL
jgi:hypothetical protein